MVEFVPASELYDVKTGVSLLHPAEKEEQAITYNQEG